MLVDHDGMIQNFPGVIREERWEKEYAFSSLTEENRFGLTFKRLQDDRYLVVWTIQPNGLYWMDHDGFGAEDDLRICLYTFLDAKGEFTGPFKLYEIEKEFFCDDPECPKI